ncbi:MAG: helix-turn-helix domain-containing protein [Nitrospiria bacterium]
MALTANYEKTYTAEEVAELLRCSPGGVRSMIRRGELRAIKVGRRYLIPESAVDALGFAEIKLFADIKDAPAYVRKIRRAAEFKEGGRRKTAKEFIDEIKADK